jgi:alpha-tubulin suppressor-like RCC1 family protein
MPETFGATGIAEISAGDQHMIGLTSTGQIWGWGDTSHGELNINNSFSGGTLVKVAAGSQRSVGLWSTGRVTGTGFFNPFSSWENVTAISAGSNMTAGRRSDGTVLVEGGPQPPAGLSGVSAVAVGEYHLLALQSNGTVTAWGGNSYGERDVPAGLANVVSVAAGEWHSLALRSNGTVVAWGAGSGTGFPHYGQSTVPAGLTGVTAICAGKYHSVALKSDGSVVCWGNNEGGQCNVPATVRNVQQVTAGRYYTAAITLPQPDIRAGANNIPVPEGARVEYFTNNGATQSRTYYITNWGTAALTGLALTKSGPDAARFAIGALPVTTLAPGANTTFTVTFAPNAAGNFFAELHIASNDPDQPSYDMVLSGRTPMGAVAWGGTAHPEYGLGGVPVAAADIVSVDCDQSWSALVRGDGTVIGWGGSMETSPRTGFMLPGGGWPGAAQVEVMAAQVDSPGGSVLGRDGSVHHYTPGATVPGAQILPPSAAVQRIAAGRDHGLALKGDGMLHQWGSIAAMPAGLGFVHDIAAGDAHSVALLSDGTVAAWGSNGAGQTAVPAGLQAVDIAAGAGFTAALRPDGTVIVWGGGGAPALVPPAGLNNVIAIEAGGGMIAAIKRDGTFVRWGTGGAPAWITRPSAIAAGSEHGLVMMAPVADYEVKRGGESWVSGLGMDAGWANAGSLRVTPFTITNTGGAALTLSTSKSGANAADFTVTGLPASLAPGATANVSINMTPSTAGVRLCTLQITTNSPRLPVFIIPLSGRTPMNVSTWGQDEGNGEIRVPQGLNDAVAVAAGWGHSLALRSNGTVVAWGRNDRGQSTVPAGLNSVVAIEAGQEYSLALRANGTVVQWGRDWGAMPAGLGGVTAISAGSSHSMALKSDRSVVVWGSGEYGSTAVPAGFGGASGVAAGFGFSIALNPVGYDFAYTAVGWGRNTAGQSAGSNAGPGIAVTAGHDHAAALLKTGTVVAWGSNALGQTTVPAGLNGVRMLEAGNYFTLALKNDATLSAWGYTFGRNFAPAGYGAIGGISCGSVHVLALTRPFPALNVFARGHLQNGAAGLNLGTSGLSAGEWVPVTLVNDGSAPLTGLAVTAGAGNAADFAFTQPAVSALAPGAATTMSVRFTPGGTGDRQLALSLASNDPDNHPFPITLYGYSGLTPVQSWRTTYMDNWANSEPYGNQWDFDYDGVLNLMEFAFGTNPADKTSAREPLRYTGPANGGGTLTARGQPWILHVKNGATTTIRGLWMRRKDYAAAGLVYTPEFAANPNSFTPSAVIPQVLASDSHYEVAAVTFPASVPGGVPRFFRVRVSIPNPD